MHTTHNICARNVGGTACGITHTKLAYYALRHVHGQVMWIWLGDAVQ